MEYAVEATGSIEAAEEISIPARVSGIIDQVTFREGDAVEEKSVLVEIEVDKFKLGEERAQAELDRARATATLAETVFKNRFALYEEGRRQKKDWVTEEQMATWKADLDKAKADLERARVDLELARRSHRDARIRPPMAGVINRKLVSKGEFVKPETIVATILNVGTLHVRFTVPELEASRLSHGQEIAFSIRSAPGRTFKARLFYLSQKADPVTRAVECKAEVREPGAALRAGTYAQVRIVTGTENSIAVPERAVLHTEKGFGAFVVEGGVARARSLKLGLRVDGQVEVLEGLREGERVVVDGALTLREGLEVEVVEPAGRPPAREAAGGGGP
jgi:RND family efflux transporter MFP subunit